MYTISESAKVASGNAGDINIELSNENVASIKISGSHSLVMPITEKLNLLAIGANGEDGKIGADGAAGCSGSDGYSATQSSSGGDGGRGGDGGHGEMGTNGGPAGNGGRIDIWVKPENLALVDAISAVVSAGKPGRKGRHGAGGPGGRGGYGGSSCSWSEPYEIQSTEHYTDHEGNSHSHVVTNTYYHYRSNPGGSDGPRGSDGGSYTHPLYPGAEGEPGQICFHIIDTSVHQEPYKLTTQMINFKSGEDSGLYEPGDLIHGFYQIENTAATMISPPESMPLILAPEPHVKLQQSGLVAGSISPNIPHTNIQNPVIFRFKEPDFHAQSKPYQKQVAIKVAPLNIRLHRSFQNSSTENVLTLQYPVILEPQPENFSIAADEFYPLGALVTNIGTKALGSNAGREVRVDIQTVNTETLLVSHSFPLIEPQQTQQIIYKESFKKGTPYCEQQSYLIDLYLQPVSRIATPTLIQRQTITGQLTPKYVSGPNQFLLVINCNTTKEQIYYWTNFLGQLSGNSGLAIWNTSYYKQFTLDGTPNLLEDTRHGTVIILDDLFRGTQPNTLVYNSQHINQKQLLEATQHYNVSLIALGANPLVKPYQSLSQTLPESDRLVRKYNSIEKLLETLLNEDKAKNPVDHEVSLPINEGWCGIGKEKKAEVIASLEEQLKKIFPNRTYHLQKTSSSAQQVTLKISRLADTLEQDICQINSNVAETLKPLIIDNLPFSQKLNLFMQQSNPYHRELAKSLSKSLLAEQSLVMRSAAHGSWLSRVMKENQRDFSLELKKLRQLIDSLHDFASVEVLSPYIIRIIAEVQYQAKEHSSFWTRFIHWFIPQTNELIVESSLKLCDKLLNLQNTSSNTFRVSVQKQEKMMDLAKQLQNFLNNYNPGAAFCFFSPPKISKNELKAMNQLLQVCKDQSSLETLDLHWLTLSNSQILSDFYAEFKELFPDYVATKTQSVHCSKLI